MKRSVVFAAARRSAGREIAVAAAVPAMKFRRLNILRLSRVRSRRALGAPMMTRHCDRRSGRTMAAPMLYSVLPFLAQIPARATPIDAISLSQSLGDFADDDSHFAQKRFGGTRQR